MILKAKLKSTGEIVEVYKRAGWHHTTYYQDANNEHKKYVSSQLDFNFIPPIRGVLNPMRPATPFTPDELVSCDPMQMIYDDVNHIARFEQTLHIRMTQEVIKSALQMATDKQLQDELKRRADERKALKRGILRCRDCKYCGEGYCSITPRWGKTTVCLKRPKPTAGNDRYYATNQSRKACEMFEPNTEL